MRLQNSFILGLSLALTLPVENMAYAQLTEQQRVDYTENNLHLNNQRYSLGEDGFARNKTITAPPIKAMGFLISPSLTVTQAYNDNILASEVEEKSGFYNIVGTHVKIDKPVGRHYFGLQLHGKTKYFYSEAGEDTADLGIIAIGNIEAHRTLLFPIKFSYSSDHIDRTYARSENITTKPLVYSDKTASVGMIYQPNRLRFEIEGIYGLKEQKGKTFFNSEVMASSDDKSHNHLGSAVRLSYLAGSDWEPFIEGKYTMNDYLEDDFNYANFNDVSRDNTFSKVIIGTLFDFKGFLTGMIGFGSETYEYKDPLIEKGNPLSLQSQIVWRPSQRMKLELDFRKRNVEDNLLASNIDETYGAAKLGYEIKQNLYSHLGLGYLKESFTEFSRDDNVFILDFGLRYRLSSTFEIHGEYSFIERRSDESNYSYDQNAVFLGIRKIF